jgi:AAA domain (dynein-related subfamily)
MAVAASLIPGFQYRINSGAGEDLVVTIIDNTPFPDDDMERRRKVTVRLPDGSVDYILPRLLDNAPVGVDSPEMPAPAPVMSAPVIEAPAAVMVEVDEDEPVAIVKARGFALSKPITDPMDPRLDHLRPSRTKVKRYINRVMPNGMTDVDFLLTFASDDYRAENEGRPTNLVLKGDTQAGKTFLVEVLAIKWADALGLPKPMPIFTLSGSSGVTDYDLFGQTTSYTDPASGQEALVWLPGVVELWANASGILYLDECNAMGERVTSSLFPVLDHRHQFVNRNKPVFRGGQFMPETLTVGLDGWVIATMNEGYRGMGELTEALVSRFEHLVWDYDEEVEKKLVKSPTIRLLGDALRTARKSNKIRTPLGTSGLQKIQRNVATFGPEMAMNIMLGQFKPNERDIVSTIVEDRSIIVLLMEEAKQAEEEAEGVEGDSLERQLFKSIKGLD